MRIRLWLEDLGDQFQPFEGRTSFYSRNLRSAEGSV